MKGLQLKINAWGKETLQKTKTQFSRVNAMTKR